MKAYRIHWDYPASADDQLYYGGSDDPKFFHHEENAQKYMEEKLKNFYEDLDPEIAWMCDTPNRGTVFEIDIMFEDEE